MRISEEAKLLEIKYRDIADGNHRTTPTHNGKCRALEIKYRDIADGNTGRYTCLVTASHRLETKYRDIADRNSYSALNACRLSGSWKPSTAI